jgi:hypothetical protein
MLSGFDLVKLDGLAAVRVEVRPAFPYCPAVVVVGCR